VFSMSFEASDFLGGLYGDRPAAPATDRDAPGPEPPATAPRSPQEHAPTHGADAPDLGPHAPGDHGDGLQPQAADAPDLDGGPLGSLDLDGWELKPDARGRLGLEPGDLPDGELWWASGGFGDLPEPGDGCPRCGSLETWSDLLGNRHCAGCDRDRLARALQLADRAARLRRNHPPVPRAGNGRPGGVQLVNLTS